jgi:hypothetical protein
MWRPELKPNWYDSPHTGLFAQSGPVAREAYDPDVAIWSGLSPLPDPGAEPPGWRRGLGRGRGRGCCSGRGNRALAIVAVAL